MKWKWGKDHDHAWEDRKIALQDALILGHPVEGLLYCLYTDASDVACRCTLQQIQKIRISDLKGTKAYKVLLKAWKDKSEIPKLYNKIATRMQHYEYKQHWESNFEEREAWTE